MIRSGQPSDASRIAEIYNYYVRNTVVTFEEEPISVHDMARRIASVTESLPWLLWEAGGSILGYAYAARWNERSAYRFSVETTIYLSPDHVRQGIGMRLYDALIAELKSRKLHCAIGAIALPNEASEALHERLGFSKIGYLKDVGWKLGRWVDVGYWQRVL
jgi:L-amino acid N-acyltransferase YncA